MIYAGFDRAECPPLATMRDLIARANLRFVGLYLPAPSSADAVERSWAGKRAPLAAMGWGFLPLYVGQQHTGRGSYKESAPQGKIDGAQAVAGMRAEGFAPGSFVYLDLENGDPFPAAQQAYVGAWVDAVEAGGYRTGVYCSYRIAAGVKALRSKVRIWAFKVPTTERRYAYGLTFDAPAPSGASPFASILQNRQNVALADFGNLVVDLNSATMADPSAPDGAVPVPPPAPVPWWRRLFGLGAAA